MVGFTKCVTVFSLFFDSILDFSRVCGGVRGKVNSAFDRARRVLSWCFLLLLWAPLCASPSEKFANPDPGYPTLLNKGMLFRKLLLQMNFHFFCWVYESDCCMQYMSLVYWL